MGICASISANSLWWQVVDDSQVWSSPISTSTPPFLELPARLPWRKASPERSTPGPLPYQMENTPSKRPSPPISAIWLPQTAVAARSSFTPGTNTTSCACRCLRALTS